MSFFTGNIMSNPQKLKTAFKKRKERKKNLQPTFLSLKTGVSHQQMLFSLILYCDLCSSWSNISRLLWWLSETYRYFMTLKGISPVNCCMGLQEPLLWICNLVSGPPQMLLRCQFSCYDCGRGRGGTHTVFGHIYIPGNVNWREKWHSLVGGRG